MKSHDRSGVNCETRGRREPRIRFAAPIKGWSTDRHGTAALFCACVLDAGLKGVRLYTYALTRPGEVVTLGYGHRKATFRVVWVAQKGSRRQGQVGLENLEPSKTLFRHLGLVVDFQDSYPPPAPSLWKAHNRTA